MAPQTISHNDNMTNKNIFKMCFGSEPKNMDKKINEGKGLRVSMKNDLSRRKGVYCVSLENLKNKISYKFNLSEKSGKDVRIFIEDGTEIEDESYFHTVPPQTFVIASLGGFKPATNPEAVNIFDHLLTVMRWSGGVEAAYTQVKHFMHQDIHQKWKDMAEYVEREQKNSGASTPEDDPTWFKDLSTNARTKESFMFRSCQARIRGYLAKAQAQLNETKDLTSLQKDQITDIVAKFKIKLKQNQYYGYYFDRSKQNSICDDSGLFLCEGRYDLESCPYSNSASHTINPYQSHEARILFSTWNLDHVIERSRSLVPTLVAAVRCRRRKVVDEEYFYDLLFTRKNLKLVHIVCHDKQEHTNCKCDPTRLYIK